MTDERFRLFVEETFTKCSELLTARGQLYAPDKMDRLRNFINMARLSKTSPETTVFVLMLKHVEALGTRILHGGDLEDPILDIINYCVLLRALQDDKSLPQEALTNVKASK